MACNDSEIDEEGEATWDGGALSAQTMGEAMLVYWKMHTEGGRDIVGERRSEEHGNKSENRRVQSVSQCDGVYHHSNSLYI